MQNKDYHSQSADWIAQCEDALRRADFQRLSTLLSAIPEQRLPAAALFCRAQIAVAHADYRVGSRQFQKAGEAASSAGSAQLALRCAIWEAYCYAQCAEYRLARPLIDSTIHALTEELQSDLLLSEASFVRGLIAANCETLTDARYHLEQAYDFAVRCDDVLNEARCSLNLAAVYVYQGHLVQAGRLIHRIEHIIQRGDLNILQIIQLQNIAIYRLRFMGKPHAALAIDLPAVDDDEQFYIRYRGWFTLSQAMAAVDTGQFDLAAQHWRQAVILLEDVRDNALSQAELHYERAWLCFRKGALEEAGQAMHTALDLLCDPADSEHIHAWAIAAAIALEQGDIAVAGRNLAEAEQRFRSIGHTIGLISVLLHRVDYYLRCQYSGHAQRALAEAFHLMHRHRIYGTYYWRPELMLKLCLLAMQEEVWEGQALQIARDISSSDTEAPEQEDILDAPGLLWGDFAASLAAQRLASEYWQEFVPLLQDSRPQVRRRAAQVLSQAQNPSALAALEELTQEADSGMQTAARQQLQPDNQAAVSIHCFGRFELLVEGKPPRLQSAGTRKALALLGALLLSGDSGIESADVALLLWPDRPEAKRRTTLHLTVWALRKMLRTALDGCDPIETRHRRYRLRISESGIWWDWDQLRRAFYHDSGDERRREQAGALYQPKFMEGFFDLLAPPLDLDYATKLRWETIYEDLLDKQEEYEASATSWVLAFEQSSSAEPGSSAQAEPGDDERTGDDLAPGA